MSNDRLRLIAARAAHLADLPLAELRLKHPSVAGSLQPAATPSQARDRLYGRTRGELITDILLTEFGGEEGDE